MSAYYSEYKNAAVLIFGLLFLFLYLSSPVVICKIINLIGLSVPKKDHLQDLILVMWKKMKETEHLYGSISFLLAISFLIYISYVHIRKYYESRHIQLFQ